MWWLNFSIPIVHLFTQFLWGSTTTVSAVSRYDLLPACKIHHRSQEITLSREGSASITENKRIIAIGDVHGSNEGLMTDLFAANVTQSVNVCEWKRQSRDGTILIQVGDIVDRGPHATEAFNCLRHLQSTATNHNSKVIRLIGNHDIWWLEGMFQYRNPTFDTQEKVMAMIKNMIDDIMTEKLVVAHIEKIHDVSVVFVHGGFTSVYLNYHSKLLGSHASIAEIVPHVNLLLKQSIQNCKRAPCSFEHALFQAGPERGGRGIGGPIWTDFGVLEKEATPILTLGYLPREFIQVVGHTMGERVRASTGLQDVGVDAGMYVGGRGFLEIGAHDGHFRAYSSNSANSWNFVDMTTHTCGLSE